MPAKIDIKLFDEYVDKRLVTKRPNADKSLWVYNYTPAASYGHAWDEVTMMSRGLIVDNDGSIVVRCMPKFFNYEQLAEESSSLIEIRRTLLKAMANHEPYRVHEKADGSLGLLYKAHDGYALSTRGSFNSDQAIKGTQMLRQYIAEHGDGWINPTYSYMLEIIYPDNRIVIDYGGAERLIMVAVLDTETGKDIELDDIDYADKAIEMKDVEDLPKLTVEDAENSEGFVVRFVGSGLRIKFKYAAYVSLHRLVTQVSSKSIWELLRNGQPFDDLLEKAPDELFEFIKETKANLIRQHDEIMHRAKTNYDRLRYVTRKEAAMDMQDEDSTVRATTFCLLDGKSEHASDIIWKSLKPKFERPFRNVEEDI